MSEDRFNRLMEPEIWGGDRGLLALKATRDVTDTLGLCMVWWVEYGGDLKPTAADLLTMTKLILDQENTLEREGWPGEIDEKLRTEKYLCPEG